MPIKCGPAAVQGQGHSRPGLQQQKDAWPPPRQEHNPHELELHAEGWRWAAVLLIALVLLLLWTLGPVPQPFVAALVLAYAPSRGGPPGRPALARPLAAVLVIVLFMLAAAALVLLVVPVIAKELPVLRQQLPQLIEEAHQRLAPVVQSLGMEWPASASHWREAIMQWLAREQRGRCAAPRSFRPGGWRHPAVGAGPADAGAAADVLFPARLAPHGAAGRRMVPPRLRTPGWSASA